MANKDFTSLSSLFKYLEEKVESTLKTEVSLEARKTMQEHIQTDVYDAYDPVHPENRRMYNDGLIDPDNIEIGRYDENTIYIEDIAYDGERNVPYIVESGDGYYAGAPDVLTRGRKFTENAREELRVSNRLPNAIIRGMKKRGIKVER